MDPRPACSPAGPCVAGKPAAEARFHGQGQACALVGRRRKRSGAGQKSECPRACGGQLPDGSPRGQVELPQRSMSRLADPGAAFHGECFPRIPNMLHEPEALMDDFVSCVRHMRPRCPDMPFLAGSCDIIAQVSTILGSESTVSSPNIERSFV